MSDPRLLLGLLQDSELTKALAMFFDTQVAEETASGLECMWRDGTPLIDQARKHACYAKAYQEAMNRLRAYAKQV